MGSPSAIFGEGGGERLATEVGLPVLARIPLDPRVVAGGDTGAPIVVTAPESGAAVALTALAAPRHRRRSRTRMSEGALPVDVYDGAAPVAPGGPSLIHDPIARVVWRVGVPAVASNLLMIVFSVTDAFWVGQRLGAVALAAVTTSLFWIWLFISVGEMIEVGLTALASRRHGEGRPEDAALAVGDALLYALGLGLLVALAGTIALPSLFAAMHTPAEVTALGRIYLGTYLLGAPGIFCYFAVDAGFRASGNTRTPLLLLASSVAITLVLDPVLILGLAGAPKPRPHGRARSPRSRFAEPPVSPVPCCSRAARWCASRRSSTLVLSPRSPVSVRRPR